MRPASQTYSSFWRRTEYCVLISPHATSLSDVPVVKEPILTAQTNAANEPHIHHLAMAEARRAEVHPHGRGRHQMFPAALVGQKGKHEVLEQAARVREGDVGAVRGVGGLLEEDGVAGDFADVDGDSEALAFERRVSIEPMDYLGLEGMGP